MAKKLVAKTMYQIVKVLGFGVQESPLEYYPTEHIYTKKDVAEKEADKLWKKNVTKKERESGWCFTNYIVKPVKIKEK